MTIVTKGLKKDQLLKMAGELGVEIVEGMSVGDLREEVSTAIDDLKSDGVLAGLTEEQVDSPTTIAGLVGLVAAAEKGDADAFQASADEELEKRQAIAQEADATAAQALGAVEEEGFEEVAEGAGGKIIAPASKKTKKIKIGKWEGKTDAEIEAANVELAAKKGIPYEVVEGVSREVLIANHAQLKSAKKAKKASGAPRAGRSFNAEQVHAIRRARLVDHKSFIVIAELFGGSPMLMRNIVVGNLYKDVPMLDYVAQAELEGSEADLTEIEA